MQATRSLIHSTKQSKTASSIWRAESGRLRMGHRILSHRLHRLIADLQIVSLFVMAAFILIGALMVSFG